MCVASLKDADLCEIFRVALGVAHPHQPRK